MSSRTAFTLSGQPVSWSLWRLVLCLYCHKDEHFAGRVFYRAAMRNPADIVPYLMKGLQKGGYMWQAHFDETERPDVVRAWVDKHILSVIHGAGPDPTQLRHELAAALEQLAQDIRGRA